MMRQSDAEIVDRSRQFLSREVERARAEGARSSNLIQYLRDKGIQQEQQRLNCETHSLAGRFDVAQTWPPLTLYVWVNRHKGEVYTLTWEHHQQLLQHGHVEIGCFRPDRSWN